MGEFVRDRLPDPVSYFEGEGLVLKGPGKWRTARCEFHGGSDSLRIHTERGAWVCMACGAKGGDVLAYHMQMHGLEFADAAKALDAYVDDAKPHRGTDKPTTLSARDAMQLVAFELLVALTVMADTRAGIIPGDEDWERFLICCSRVEVVATEYRA